MTKLTKSDEKTRDEHIAALRKAQEQLEDAASAYNNKIISAWLEFSEVLNHYNDAVSDADGFRNDIAESQQTYIDEKSEAWQEGDRGSAYSDWKSHWEEEFEPLQVDGPVDIELDGLDHADKLEELPGEVEG